MNKSLLKETYGSVHSNRNETFYNMELSSIDFIPFEGLHPVEKAAHLFFCYYISQL